MILLIVVAIVLLLVMMCSHAHFIQRMESFGVNAEYYLSGDGAWAGQMQPAAASADGSTGLVPPPKAGSQNMFLRGDGTWSNPVVANYLFATSIANQTVGTVPVAISFPDILSSNCVTALSSSTFALSPDATYKLSASIPYCSINIIYRWYNVTTGKYIPGDGSNNSSTTQGPAQMSFIKTTAPTTIALYAIVGTGSLIYGQGTNSNYLGPCVSIEMVGNNTGIMAFTGATATTNGSTGHIPMPQKGQHNYVLTGGGGWQVGTPPGAVINYAGNTPPPGYLVCNGSLVSRVTYADLFAAISTLYGGGDGSTTFSLPDLRGMFIRGLDSGRGINGGRTIGTNEDDTIQEHGHILYEGDGGGAGKSPATRSDDDNGLIKFNGGFGQTYVREIYRGPGVGGGDAPRVSHETRPKNVAMIMCIKT